MMFRPMVVRAKGVPYMKRLLLSAALACVMFGSANAQVTVLEDPLHGYCSAGCSDNGTNTPMTSNPPVNGGFTVSPKALSGSLTIDFLIPDNVSLSSINITGAANATATLFSATPWTSGALDGYLGISASPNNPIG